MGFYGTQLEQDCAPACELQSFRTEIDRDSYHVAIIAMSPRCAFPTEYKFDIAALDDVVDKPF